MPEHTGEEEGEECEEEAWQEEDVAAEKDHNAPAEAAAQEQVRRISQLVLLILLPKHVDRVLPCRSQLRNLPLMTHISSIPRCMPCCNLLTSLYHVTRHMMTTSPQAAEQSIKAPDEPSPAHSKPHSSSTDGAASGIDPDLVKVRQIALRQFFRDAFDRLSAVTATVGHCGVKRAPSSSKKGAETAGWTPKGQNWQRR